MSPYIAVLCAVLMFPVVFHYGLAVCLLCKLLTFKIVLFLLKVIRKVACLIMDIVINYHIISLRIQFCCLLFIEILHKNKYNKIITGRILNSCNSCYLKTRCITNLLNIYLANVMVYNNL